jgi:hypothetical protein
MGLAVPPAADRRFRGNVDHLVNEMSLYCPYIQFRPVLDPTNRRPRPEVRA